MDAYLDGMKAILPELVLTAGALGALVLDLLMRGRDSKLVGYFTMAVLALVGMILVLRVGSEPTTAFGMVVVDSFGVYFKLFTVAALMVVTSFVLADRRERKHNIGEYYFLLLGAAIGIFFMVSTNHLLLLMLGLELLSLASYSLAGFHKGERKSAEAAMKYVVFGGLSAGVMLYGISLLYGLTGTLDLAVMASAGGEGMPVGLVQQLGANPVPVALAMVMVLAGFAYKMSVVPFHFWTPDVYEGAPTPVTTFLAVASKAAGVAALLRFLAVLFLGPNVQEIVAQYGAQVGQLLAILAALTMTLGNLAAMRQTSLKRLLAYSSIAHAGYILIGVAAMTGAGFEAAMYYLAAYYFMNLGAFGVVLYFEGCVGSDRIEDLEGYGWKAPLVSIAMVAFLVSLTGLPPTVGFYGKYLLFKEGLDVGLYWLVGVAALNSVVSLFYYFRIAKALFLKDAGAGTVNRQPLFAGLLTALSVLTIFFGLMPETIEQFVRKCLLVMS
ncbi:MAG: NADH-quinone oxidoreductase subunit N [Planctomycetes bacterium]|nr:NADH-quinone oxidoreductase subunit N [Planctomycetota bacterium]